MSLWLRRSFQTAVFAVAVVVIHAWPMSGPATAPKYDVATESKMKVTV